MNWKNRLTNYNFWISIFSAVLLILQALKIEFDIAYVNEIFTAVLGLLVVIGIISDPTRMSVKSTETTVKTKPQKVVEEKLEEKTQKLPINEKNENCSISNEIDFQTVLNKIVADLEEKTSMLIDKFKDEKIKNETIETHPQTEQKENINESTEENIQPAVAENINPYVDVIN